MKIIFVPNQPHCYAFGGFEIQMLSAFEGLKRAGHDVERFDPWSRDLDFDLVHIWGLEITQAHNIDYARRSGKAIVVTVLMPDLSSFYKRLRFLASSLVYKVRIQKELSRKVDAIIAVSEIEKETIRKFYGFPEQRIHVIPNMIGDIYLDETPAPNTFGVTDYVLCTGNVCQRKNQLNLVRACNRLKIPVLLIGNEMPGEEIYAANVRNELAKNASGRWIPGVQPNSEMLKSAYQHCRLFALLSYLENQPISVLEAQAMGCRILLASRPYTRQSLFKDLPTVDPDGLDAITRAVEQAYHGPVPATPAIGECTMKNVARRHAEVYATCMSLKGKTM